MISIIVVNYNASNFLYENLKSISKSNLSKIEYEIIVIDNNSTIKLDENELNQYNVKLLHLKKNVGYASALNYGIKKSVGKYLLTINPDILFKEDSIERLYNYYQSNKIGVIGCKVLNFNGTYQLSSRRRFPSFKHLFCKLFKINKYYNYIDYDIDMIYNATTLNPPMPIEGRELSRDKTKIDKLDLLNRDAKESNPFFYINKAWVIKQYKDNNILDLLYTTRSCEGGDVKTPANWNGERPDDCGECFWCGERHWAMDENNVEH